MSAPGGGGAGGPQAGVDPGFCQGDPASGAKRCQHSEAELCE